MANSMQRRLTRETGGEKFGRTLALGLRRYRRARSSGEIRAEQVRAVFRQMPIALVVNTVNAIITAAVLQQLAGVALPLGWLCVVLLVTAGRCTLWLRYRGTESRVVDFTQWSWGATCGSLLAGMCWGLSGMALFPIALVPGQIFMILGIGGMCTGAVVMSASHLSSLLAFLLSASLPMAVLFFRQGTTTATASGAMILVFAVALSAAGLHLSRFFVKTIQLRRDLEVANLRLQAEMAEREVTEVALREPQKVEAIGRLTG